MAASHMLQKLQNVESTFEELTVKLADPEVATDPTELQRVPKARSALEQTVTTYHEWQCVQ